MRWIPVIVSTKHAIIWLINTASQIPLNPNGVNDDKINASGILTAI